MKFWTSHCASLLCRHSSVVVFVSFVNCLRFLVKRIFVAATILVITSYSSATIYLKHIIITNKKIFIRV
ncbi:hypothetical protein RO3G_11516 [Rhizopus delemar RA 99-880]|uniref:Uncharacterized protein n=1 Tax=Rhizopus delemar (strain RA 99-880 / ATCC MYA-4621 / FGSC 9543 / NRRL 43880) TaxID=246409 RepID=I1CEC5_RHIO9|nr:hypothetical protein RO3G_11516 [Rhizopus delemar RA 99-880]|eukprot:EIE86805.1 hypothetical protein RO3G_11516 [Rhizopus delemar RA 99-880]